MRANRAALPVAGAAACGAVWGLLLAFAVALVAALPLLTSACELTIATGGDLLLGKAGETSLLLLLLPLRLAPMGDLAGLELSVSAFGGNTWVATPATCLLSWLGRLAA